MTFEELKNNYVSVVKDKFFCFEGRADRKEFWYFVLANFCVAFLIGCIDGLIGAERPYLGSLYSLAVLLPNLGVSVRRLHDIGKSGWWLFLSLLPPIGTIILIVWACKPSVDEGNQYDITAD